MPLTILDSTAAASTSTASTQAAQVDALLAPFGEQNVTVLNYAGAVLAHTSTHGSMVKDTATPRGWKPGALLATTVNVTEATITRRVYRTAGGVNVYELTAAELTPSPLVTKVGRRMQADERSTASATLPVAGAAALTFAASDSGEIGLGAAGSITNTGDESAAWSIAQPANCTVSPSSGTVAPGATQTLTITASEAGGYTLTLVSPGVPVTGATQTYTINTTGEALLRAVASRATQPQLFQTVAAGDYPSRIDGGGSYNADIWGPTRAYVDFASGWQWVNPGGDWVDASLVAQGATPWASFAANAVSGSTAVHTYTGIDCSALVKHCHLSGAWLAVLLTSSGGARAIAGPLSVGQSAPSIAVTYIDGTSDTLACRIVAGNTPSSFGPTTAEQINPLPVFIEFERPAKSVASAAMSVTVSQHWSGDSTLQMMLLNPPKNTDADTGAAGLATLAGSLDVGLSSVSGIMGVQRFQDGSVLSDFVTPIAYGIQSESNYDPAIWGGAQDLTKLPHVGASKWLDTSNGATDISVVNSSYAGEGFVALAPGIGAMRLGMADNIIADGDEVGNGGTLGADLRLLFPDASFGTEGRVFVRYYVRMGTPYAPAPADRLHVLSGGAPRWTDMTGKFGIGPMHQTSYGGVSGSSGGGYGWQMRQSWYDCEAATGGPDEGGVTQGFHLYDYQSNNPIGHRYGTEQPSQFERWGQRGGRGAVMYAGQWYCVEVEMDLNTVTAPSSYSEDGALRAWVDGRLVFERTGMVFRTLPLHDPGYISNKLRPARELGAAGLWLNWFHGGQSDNTYPRTLFYTGIAWGRERIGAMKSPMPSWVPAPGSVSQIAYTSGSHPEGLPATRWDIRTQVQPWNPTPADLGPWAAGTPGARRFAWTSITAYCGFVYAPTTREYIGYGGGHATVCVPVPYAFDLNTRSWKWLAAPPPTDAFEAAYAVSLVTGLPAGSAANLAQTYPPEQYDPQWGEWKGDYSGWGAYARPGQVFPEPGHTDCSIVWVPGDFIGNTNGAVIPLNMASGRYDGGDRTVAHWFDLDEGQKKWKRLGNKRFNGSTGAGGAVYFGGSVKKLFALNRGGTRVHDAMDVLDGTTKLWTTRTATNGAPISVYTCGMGAHLASGLLLSFHQINSSGQPFHTGVTMGAWAVDAATAAAGSHTWQQLTISAESWPLNNYTSTDSIGWCYCPRNGCFYATGGVHNSTTLWKLSPPAGAVTQAEVLAGTWTVTTETLSAPIQSRNGNGGSGPTPQAVFVYNRLVWDEMTGCLLFPEEYMYGGFQAIRPAGV